MDTIEERYVSNAQGNWHVRLVADIDSTPFDADCYSDGDIAAWRADEWRYVGIIVTDVQSDTGASMGGVEYGQLADIPYIGMTEIIESYFDDLRAEVVIEVARRAEVLTRRAAELTAAELTAR